MIPVVLLSHGSPDPRARAAAEVLAAAVGRAGTMPVATAYLQHDEPGLVGAARGLARAGHRAAVVVPMLLSTAHHARVDVPAECRRATVACGLRLVVADPLGPDPLLLPALDRRVPPGPAVLAAAGSSDRRACDEVESLAAAWSRRRGATVEVGYASQCRPDVRTAIEMVQGDGAAPVGVGSLILYPGLLASRIAAAAGPRPVSTPLYDTPELVRLVRRRIAAALDRHRARDACGDATH